GCPKGRRLAVRSDEGGALPEPHADARASWFQRHFSHARADAPAHKESGCLYLRTRGRRALHDAADERADTRLQFCGAARKFAEDIFDADVSADAGWADDAGGFLQPAGESHGRHVPYGQAALSDRAYAADHRLDRERGREFVSQSDAG